MLWNALGGQEIFAMLRRMSTVWVCRIRWLIVPLLTLGILSRADTQTSKSYKGRIIAPVMSAAGADWLVREDREKYEQPEKVLDALQLTPQMTIADIGAGVGYFSLRISLWVPQGRVLAVDVQPEMIELLRKNIRQANRSNIEPILSTETDPDLSPMSVDMALMVDVYHELQYPEEMVAGIRRALKPSGRLVLVEYRGEDPQVPIKPEHKMTAKQVLNEIEPMGFHLKDRFDFLPWQHILVFEKN
jgi:SAM-dependent methyltransferase